MPEDTSDLRHVQFDELVNHSIKPSDPAYEEWAGKIGSLVGSPEAALELLDYHARTRPEFGSPEWREWEAVESIILQKGTEKGLTPEQQMEFMESHKDPRMNPDSGKPKIVVPTSVIDARDALSKIAKGGK